MAGFGTGGYGRVPYGTGDFGEGEGPMAFQMQNAVAQNSRVVRVRFTEPPRARDSVMPSDALNLFTWSLLAPDGSFPVLLKVAPAPNPYVDPPIDLYAFDLYLAADFMVGVYTVATPTMLSEAGEQIVLPATATFDGIPSVVTSLGRTLLQGATVDLANKQVPTDDTFGGTLVMDSDGDYASETGASLYKKLVLRRLLTSPGDFFHLPDYGVGLREKALLKDADLQALKRRVEVQLAAEPGLEKVRAALSWDNARGTLVVRVSAIIRKTGSTFQVTTAVPLQL